MNTNRFVWLMVLLLMTAGLLLVGGCSRHYVDVYIHPNCYLVSLENDDEINPLIVYKGDYVIFNSMREATVTMRLPAGMFEEDEVDIEGGARVILKVIGEASMAGQISFSGTGCDVGDPDVKIGEGP